MLLWECLMEAFEEGNCCGIWPPIFLGVMLLVWLWGRQGAHTSITWADWCCSTYGSGDIFTISCGSSGAIPTELRNETHHGVEVERVAPLLGFVWRRNQKGPFNCKLQRNQTERLRFGCRGYLLSVPAMEEGSSPCAGSTGWQE